MPDIPASAKTFKWDPTGSRAEKDQCLPLILGFGLAALSTVIISVQSFCNLRGKRLKVRNTRSSPRCASLSRSCVAPFLPCCTEA